MSILFCFGTRPEWLKIKPILNLLDRDQYKLLFTGQHLDLLKDVKADFKINILSSTDNRLDNVISNCLEQFPNENFKGVLVQGDTASAFGCAVAALHRKLKIFYLEAGLRSFDLQHPYPEEAYRQMISRISDVNFAPTELSRLNLKNENVKGSVFVTGNTILDNLLNYKKNCSYDNKILITLHRRENVFYFKEWFKKINDLAKSNSELKFIFPMHPNEDVQRHKNLLTHVEVIPPLQHQDLLNLLTKSKFLITDSGGLQEEGSFLNKKIIVCRKTTERPEGINTGHIYLCNSPNKLKKIFYTINDNFIIDTICPYGDGNSSKKIIDIIYND